jgi:hypothetical protein
MRRALLFCAAIAFATACGDNITEPVPDRGSQTPTVSFATSTSDDGLSITTDKDDYAPGDTVHFTGAGWPANDVLDIQLDDEPATHEPHTWIINVGDDGTFRDSTYVVDVGDLGVTFTLTATSRGTGRSLTVTFTDAAPTNVSFTLNSTTFTFPAPPPANQNATNPITVGTGASVTINVTATTVAGTPGGANWQSTGVSLRVNGGASFGTETCDDFDVVSNNTVQTTSRQFTFSAPSPASTTKYDVRVRAYIGNGCSGASGATPTAREFGVLIVSANQPPEVDAGGPYSGDEGSDIALNEATASDPDDDPLDYTWTINYGANPEGATCTFKDPNNASNPTPHKVLHPSINCNDNGTFTVRLTVSDGIASPVYDEAQLTVDNVPPDITAVVVLPFVDGYVYPITGQPTVDATYTDQGSHDTHTCMFEVFDYQNIEVGPDRTCGASLGVTEAGVYTVKVTVTDDDGGSDYETIQVVVYDPSAGFVTGGGWIYSAAGAYKADMSLEGKATFGFVSKYITQKDKTTPALTGNTEFVFHAGNLNFNSSSYEWLVVNGIGTRAQYKGKGTINGGGVLYPFILTAVDGKTGGTDQFRMQIFQTDGETVLYDNYVSGPATEQPLGSGSIVIHVPKKTT